ncbi:hypothetical protein [Micromonospora sp. NPDC005189]|uniref:hypothetical protein n=1 Tax=Micromonospora sp. NPDC005189 TaxID=3157019 RepID=UPI0033A27E5E
MGGGPDGVAGGSVVGGALDGDVGTVGVGVGGLVVWLGFVLGLAETEASGESSGAGGGRSGRPGSTVAICSFAAGSSSWPVGATVGEVVGRLTAGSSPASCVAPSAAPSPTNATSTAAAAPTSGPRRRRRRRCAPLATAAPAGAAVR